MMNKKGIEISINFIVILIITIVVFAGSLTIAAKLLKKTNDLKQSMDKQTQERLESMITNGNEEVIIAFNKKEVEAGNSVVFGLGVLNTLGVEKTFTVSLYPSTAISNTGGIITFDPLTPSSIVGWVYLQDDNIGSIKNNEHKTKSLVIIPAKNAVPGVTYVFDVKVTYDTTFIPYPQSSPVKKIRVTII